MASCSGKQHRDLGVYEQRHIIRLENNMPFEEQLLACYQTLVDGTSDHRALRHSGLLIMTLVLSNPPSHKVGPETPSQPVKMKLWAVLCRATKDGQVLVESSDTHTHKNKPISDNTWFTGEGNGKPLQYSSLENPMNSMKRQKDMTPEADPLRSVGVPYANGEKWRNSSRRNEEPGPKWIWCSDVDVSESGES